MWNRTVRSRALLVLGSVLSLAASIADARPSTAATGGSVSAGSNQVSYRLPLSEFISGPSPTCAVNLLSEQSLDSCNLADSFFLTRFISDIVGLDNGAKAMQGTASTPELINPSLDTELPGADVTFTWVDNGATLEQWYVRVGSSQGRSEFAEIRITDPSTMQLQVTGLPTDGVTPVFVALSYRQKGQWTTLNYEYRAFDDVNAPSVPNNPPLAMNDTVGPVTTGGSLTFSVVTNDTDEDGVVVAGSVVIVAPPSAGTAMVEDDGRITYMHDGSPDTISDALSYSVLDDDGEISNTATVSIIPINNEPVASQPELIDPLPGTQLPGADVTFKWIDNGTALEQWYVRVGLLEGTSEFSETRITDRSTTQLRVTGLPSEGVTPVFVELSYRQQGQWTTQNYEYLAFDGTNAPSVPNNPPLAMNDAVGPMIVGGSLTFSVIANDTDEDGAVVANSVVIINQPQLGTAVVEDDGRITYTHDGTIGVIQDVLSYTVRDNDGAESNTATVTIAPFNDPSAPNNPPLAMNDTVGPVTSGGSLTFSVVTNDTDEDGIVVAGSVVIVAPPAAGTAMVEDDGRITYTHGGSPDTISDAMSYAVLDDDGELSNTAIVSITPIIPEPVVLVPVLIDPLPGTALPGADVTFMWIDNGTALEQWYVRVGLLEGTSEFSESRIREPSTTQLQVNGLPTDGVTPVFVELSYRQRGQWTSQNYEYRSFDDASAPSVPNNPPLAMNDTVGPVITGGSLTFSVVTNDTDEDGAIITDSVVIVNQPQLGTAVIEDDGQITYTHDGALGTLQDVLRYAVFDDDGDISNTATVTIAPFFTENSPPVATNDIVGPVKTGESLTFSVLANDTDADGEIVVDSVFIVAPPAAGIVIVEADGQITYTHDGTIDTVQDLFTYTVLDDNGDISNTASVTITPFSVQNVSPIAADDIVGPATIGEVLIFSVTGNDTDSDGIIEPDTVEIVRGPQHGTASVDLNGDIIYRHDGASITEQDSLVYTVLDNNGSSTNEATITIAPFIARKSLTASLLRPLDISFNNSTWSDNPFDLLATATITHDVTNTVRSGELYYDGEDTWKLRFVADQPGNWEYVTQSADVNLDGHTGSISVAESQEKGFVRAQGDKWIRSATGQAFVPQYVMAGTLIDFARDPGKIDNDLNIFIDEHGFNGFHIRGYCQWFKLGSDRCSDIPIGERDPDLQTFKVVEDIITQTSARGGTTHIWMYGDNFRGQNPSDWGLNGSEDKRVQRYLAARLGALPGWTIGYGYDVSEWASPSQIEDWFLNLNDKMMYPHLTGARGDKNVLMQHTEILSYSSYEQHNPTFDTYINTITERPEKPSFSEDRFRIDEVFAEKDYTFEETRRGMWHSAMAGGVANIWGNLQFDMGGSYNEGSRIYPNREELKIYSDFMSPRFRVDLETCNVLLDGLCLQASSQAYYILYKEEASELSIDLSTMPGPSTYLAMETTTGETVSGLFEAEQQLWIAPNIGDWVMEITLELIVDGEAGESLTVSGEQQNQLQ